MMDGEEHNAVWIFLYEPFGSKESFVFGIFVFQWFLGWVGSFLGLPHGMSCLSAECVPVLSVVADEVSDFAESLIQDGLLKGHVLVWGGGSVDNDGL
jgi:hypothetical protein